MHQILLALAGPAAIGLVLGIAIGWDRLREPHRPLTRPTVVVDRRTFRDARRKVERLVAAEEWMHAYAVATAICKWLGNERHYGRATRRRRLAAELETWTARKQEMRPF
ncbi:MAG: hypothetical protein ABIQ18_48515 [Umezawaea sp.]